jgi:glycosyltransferase involved in cell wall biosynthesis
MRGSERRKGGVLLIGPVSDGPLVGGIENGIDMILRSSLVEQYGVVFFNSYRAKDRERSWAERLGYQLAAFARFVAVLVRHRPRLVHLKVAERLNFVQGVGYLLLARLAGRPVLLQIHGGTFDRWYGELGGVGRAAIRLSLRAPTAVLVLSDYWRAFFHRLAPAQAMLVVPNGVELRRRAARREKRDGRFEVVTIGAVGKRKGHFDIVEAAKLLADDVSFRFIGGDDEGGERARIRELVDGGGLSHRIELPGPLTGDIKWAALERADVFLLPAYNENMPNSVLEAMAAALPIVTTDVGAIREMLGEEGALYVPPGEPQRIAAALRALQADPERRRAMGETNAARVRERFAFDGVRRALGELYHRFGAGPDAALPGSPAPRVEGRDALAEACQPARRN